MNGKAINKKPGNGVDRPVPQPVQPQTQPQQQMPETVPGAEVQAIINELNFRRSWYMDRATNLAVQVQLLQKELADLKATLPTTITDPEPKADEPKVAV
jgi:hypothetical protein